jgi:hypothetical protein
MICMVDGTKEVLSCETDKLGTGSCMIAKLRRLAKDLVLFISATEDMPSL